MYWSVDEMYDQRLAGNLTLYFPWELSFSIHSDFIEHYREEQESTVFTQYKSQEVSLLGQGTMGRGEWKCSSSTRIWPSFNQSFPWLMPRSVSWNESLPHSPIGSPGLPPRSVPSQNSTRLQTQSWLKGKGWTGSPARLPVIIWTYYENLGNSHGYL